MHLRLFKKCFILAGGVAFLATMNSPLRADPVNSDPYVPLVSVGTTPSDNAYGVVAVSNGGNAQGNVAVSTSGTATGDVAISALGHANALCIVGGASDCELEGQAYDLDTLTTPPGGMDLAAAATSDIFPNDPDFDGVPGLSAADVLAPSESFTAAAGTGSLPSCANITYRGNGGAIYVQTSSTGSLQWGIYMYRNSDNYGFWNVDVYVNAKRKDHKAQTYPPHGSLPASAAVSGRVFQIKATLSVVRTFFGFPYFAYFRNVPNACVIP